MAESVLSDVDRALVVGLGRSGQAAVAALRAAGVAVVVADDRRSQPGAAVARDAGAEVRLGDPAEDSLEGVGLVVPSPGVPERAPVLRAAERAGVPVWSEPELGWRLHPRRLIAITGTNGKTSVTELVAAMLAETGIDARACGNIGTALTTAAAEAAEDTVLVAELSSFQLRFCHALRPEVGVLLNVAPDHLDWHGDITAYGAAKARIWQAQGDDDWAVVNADDGTTMTLSARAPGRVAVFSDHRLPTDGLPGLGWEAGVLTSTLPGRDTGVVSVAELALDAPHHRSNVAAAATAALLAGAAPAAVGRAAARFRPGRHHMEVVASGRGITFVDDSKATNPHAAAAALASYGSIVWIAGGLAKGVDVGVLAEHLGAVRHAVLIGEAAADLAAVCDRAGVAVTFAGDMESAVREAGAVAVPGDTVLLAPACASFDMFDDYADRGDRFATAARRDAEATPGTTDAHEEDARGRG